MNAYNEDITNISNQKAETIIADLPNFCKKYFNSIKLTKAARTRLQYAYDLQRFFKWLSQQAGFKDVDMNVCTAQELLGELNVEDMQEYVASIDSYNDGKRQKSYSSAYIARNIASLKSFFNYYYKIREIDFNLGFFLDVPKQHKKEIQVLNNSQVNRIQEAVFNETGMTQKQLDMRRNIVLRDYAIISLFFTTGLRVSEMVGLDVTDIDFKNKTIIVTRKGGDQDVVYPPTYVLDAINNYIKSDREVLVDTNIEKNALWLSLKHSRLSVQAVEQMIKKYAKLAGVNTNVTPHTLRRTFGTNLYNETGDLGLVADTLHHASTDTTRKHYAKSSEAHKRKAAEVASKMYHNDD